jgi:hypothetical protein
VKIWSKSKDKSKDVLRSGLRAYGDMVINMPFVTRFPRFAHYSRQFTPLIFIGTIGWSYLPVHGYPWWYRVLNLLVTYATVYAVMAGMSHTARLCEYCVKKFPLNGSQLAAKRRHRLWAYHFHWKRWILGPLAVELLIDFVGPHFGLRGQRNVMAWTIPALMFVWGYQRIIMTHDRLTAWCPWCRHNRPPDETLIPDPDPSQNIPVPA